MISFRFEILMMVEEDVLNNSNVVLSVHMLLCDCYKTYKAFTVMTRVMFSEI